MNTGNTLYLDQNNNREYYSKSDGNFMPLEASMRAHLHIPRIAWAREKVHDLASHKHLDVGMKDGYLCLTLALEGVDCLGLDPSEDAVATATLKAQQTKATVRYQTGFIEDLETEETFDTVSCLEVIEHVVDVDILLKKLTSLARYVIISTPDINGRHGLADAERNVEHVRLFSEDELKELCSRYGEVLETKLIDDQICILFEKHES